MTSFEIMSILLQIYLCHVCHQKTRIWHEKPAEDVEKVNIAPPKPEQRKKQNKAKIRTAGLKIPIEIMMKNNARLREYKEKQNKEKVISKTTTKVTAQAQEKKRKTLIRGLEKYAADLSDSD